MISRRAAKSPASMRRAIALSAACTMLLGAGLGLSCFAQQKQESIAAVQQGFLTPPDDARVMMRWWWFGPAVVKPELEREILAMKAGGIGGFEIQPVYPMALDNSTKGLRNLPYLSDGFLDALKFAAAKGRENGMRVDITLASGWPYGGPNVPVNEAASQLRMVAEDFPAGSSTAPSPALGNGEKIIAVFRGEGSAKKYDSSALKQIAADINAERVALQPDATARVVLFFIAGRTGQQVKRAAVGAEGLVLDPFNRAAVDHHLTTVADRLMEAFGDTPPYAVFSDSLEVYSADWTDDLLSEFARRRGYDLTPHLPDLWSGTAPDSAALRHDWGQTLTELINERYLTPINEWAAARHTRFRSQTYGEPAVSLSSNSLVGLPEGEGPQWRAFSFTRLASSASHLYGHPITSAETWTWLHSPAFRATPLDMKVEADRFFLQGVNQLIGHGWPYTPPGVAEPGWSFYAAAVFNDHNPWWPVMPQVTRYLQRISYLLRQGRPANDIAVLLPNDDAYSTFKPGHVSLSAGMAKYITPALIQQILNSGYNLDYIDAEAVANVGIHYPMLVLPHVDRLSPATLKAVAAYVAGGGKVISVGSLPAHAPGFTHAEEISVQVAQLSKEMFAGNHGGRFVSNDADLGAALQQALQPDMNFVGEATDLGFVHRKLEDADIYFIVNSSNHPTHTAASFRASRKYAAWWDPFTGEGVAIDGAKVPIELAPYESRLLVYTDTPLPQVHPARPEPAWALLADLTYGWAVDFPSLAISRTMDQLHSWTDDPSTRFFSGEAVYTRSIRLTPAQLRGAQRIVLDFGPGTPVEPDPAIQSGIRALLESPVREAAMIRVNGNPAGSLWHPPYRVVVGTLLHPGDNAIEIHVTNLAINQLADRAPTDYRLLTSRYGRRFAPQDMDHLEPLPSGILGTIHLLRVSNVSSSDGHDGIELKTMPK